MNARYRSRPVDYVEVGPDEFVVLDTDEPRWAVINGSAAWVLDRCGAPTGGTVAEILAAGGRPPGVATVDDVVTALEGLQAAGLVSCEGVPRPSPATGRPSDFAVEHLYIELLARCNLRCTHCYMSGGPERREALDAEEAVDLVRRFARLGGRYVTLSGGEPFLYRRFDEVAQAVGEAGLGGTVITNGTALRARHVRVLDELGFQLAVSLDGVSASTNDPIRGAGSFDRTVRAIDMAATRIDPRRMILSFTPTRTNLDDIPALFTFARDRGIPRLNLSLVEHVGRGAQNREEHELSAAERDRLVEIVYDRALAHLGVVEVDFNDTRNILDIFAVGPHDTVHALWRGVRVDSSGDCFPSTFGSDPHRRLGNVRETPLESIVTAPVLTELERALRTRYRRIPRCAACSWRQLCRAGRVPSSAENHGRLDIADSYCGSYLKTYPRVAKALAAVSDP